MNYESAISERGQITLPKELRDRLGLKPGTVVRFTPSPQGLLIKKQGGAANPIRDVFGVIRDGIKTDDYLKKTRGHPE